MDLKEFLLLIKRKRQTIALILASAVIITAAVSLLFPLRYEASSRLLITQESGEADAYMISRSNEYLGNLFAQVIHSSSFFDLSMDSQYNVEQSYFSGNYAQKMKIWRDTVQSRTLSDSGIVEISVYHSSPYQAQQLALAVNDVMINKNSNYQSNGDKVKINIIDQPLVSTYPVKPNLLQNSALAAVFSLIFALFYIYIFPEDRYDWLLFGKKKHQRREQKKELATNAVWQSLPVAEQIQSASEAVNTPAVAQSLPMSPQGNINNILR
jgi:capsular polysaccharide biosynthesis protein